MATMMKLSLNRFQRADMLKKGLVKWLLNHMEDVEYSATKYHFEYMTALLMILFTHPFGTNITFSLRSTLGLLARYLQINIPVSKTYIRAALLSMLKNAKIAGCARTMNFDDIIESGLKVKYYKHVLFFNKKIFFFFV